MPYLPIDPKDVGRSYEAVIRVNSQSGKGGVAYLLEQEAGYVLPRQLSVELSQQIQARAERDEAEISPAEIHAVFSREYIAQAAPIKVVGYRSEVRDGKQQHAISAEIDGVHHVLSHDAPGPIDAFVHCLSQRMGEHYEVESYTQHALDQGSKARAVAYVCVRTASGERRFGVGVHESIVSASLAAVASAVNRVVACRERERAVG